MEDETVEKYNAQIERKLNLGLHHTAKKSVALSTPDECLNVAYSPDGTLLAISDKVCMCVCVCACFFP